MSLQTPLLNLLITLRWCLDIIYPDIKSHPIYWKLLPLSKYHTLIMEEAASIKTEPSKFLSNIIGSAVRVKLHSGVSYSGNLQSIDGYMNIVLDSTVENVGGANGAKYGDVFIRGNNGMYTA